MKKNVDDLDDSNELNPLDVVIEKLQTLDSNILLENNHLLKIIESNRNINTVDKDKKTVLHHLINRVNFEPIDQIQLKGIVGIIKDLALLMSERALHLPDNKGVSALQLAADCKIPEIYYATIGIGLPDYEIPYFGKPAYTSSFKDFRSSKDCKSSSEVFSSFAKSAWGIEAPKSHAVPSASSNEISKELTGDRGYCEGSWFY